MKNYTIFIFIIGYCFMVFSFWNIATKEECVLPERSYTVEFGNFKNLKIDHVIEVKETSRPIYGLNGVIREQRIMTIYFMNPETCKKEFYEFETQTHF